MFATELQKAEYVRQVQAFIGTADDPSPGSRGFTGTTRAERLKPLARNAKHLNHRPAGIGLAVSARAPPGRWSGAGLKVQVPP